MFRFLVLILLQCAAITSVLSTSFRQYDNSTTYLDCSCSAEIEIIRTFMEDLEAVRKRTDEIGTEISLIQKQLHANRKAAPSNCMEAAAGRFKSGIYEIQLEKFAPTPFAVWCNEDIEYGGWMVIQRRESDSVDFYRGWEDYKNGFGIPSGNFWLGLEKLHVLTTSCEQELYIEMKRFNGESYYATYSEFVIGNESEDFVLKKLGSYAGTSNDSLTQHVGIKFTTFDRDNDGSANNCARIHHGGWWFKKCYNCYLNGEFKKPDMKGYGINWNTLEKQEALKFAQMMIRPTKNCLRRMLLRT